MKIALGILLWISVGFGSAYATRIYGEQGEFLLHHAMVGAILGPIMTPFGIVITIGSNNPCIANCR